MKVRLLSLAVVLLVPALAFAGSACNFATVVPSDGRVVDFDFVAPSPGINYYQFNVSAGRSYSVEVRQDYDDINTDITVSAFTDNACGTPLNPALIVDTKNADPALPANATRFSFTTPSSPATQTIYLKVANGNTTGRYVSVSISETTWYTPRWTTTQGFITVFGVENTTSQIGHVVMTATIDSPAPGTVTFPVTLQPNTRSLFALGPNLSMNVAAGSGGFLLLTSDLPPGGILADSLYTNGGMIVPAVFTPARMLAH